MLPAKDRGPVRRYVRDYVDSRRNVIGLFIPVAIPLFLLGLTKVELFRYIASIGFEVFVVGVLVDTTYVAWRIRQQVAIRFPGQSSRGAALYAVSRAMLFRRMRLPGPRVARGAKV